MKRLLFTLSLFIAALLGGTQGLSAQTSPTGPTESCPGCNTSLISITQVQLSDCRYYFQIDNQSGCPLVNVQWQYGDGASASGWNANHIYNGVGPFTLTANITISGSNGTCLVVRTLTIVNNCTPPDMCNNCNMSNISITQQVGTDCRYYFGIDNQSGCQLQNVQWQYGDGTGASGWNANHIYSGVGPFTLTATITVISSTGAICTTTKTLTITNNCTPPDMCENCNMSNISITQQQGTDCRYYFGIDNQSGCQLASVQWTFGDGLSSSGWNTNHLYAGVGPYTLTAVITVTSANGATCTTTKKVTITNNCTPPVMCENCNMSNISITQQQGTDCRYYFGIDNQSGCQLVNVQWTFGDGLSSSGWNTNHLYAGVGPYTLTAVITVTSANGATCTTTRTLTITNNCTSPVMCENCNMSNISITQQQGTDCRYYFGIDNQSGCQLVNVQWTFGDGLSSSGWNTNHLYAGVGPYTLTAVITVTSANGAICTTTRTLTITNNCTPQVPCNGCDISKIYLTQAQGTDCRFYFDVVNNSGCQLYGVFWEFGDGATASGWNASHHYTTPGTYTLTATVSVISATGQVCTSKITMTVVVSACKPAMDAKMASQVDAQADAKLKVLPTVIQRGGTATAKWGENTSITELRLIDLQGRVISKLMIGDTHEVKIEIPATLNAGVYILVTDSPTAGTAKIVVQ